jgi:Sugar (and other) transporter
MFLYMDCFTLGVLLVSWSYSAEIQPLRVRNKSTAVGVFSHWLSNFAGFMVTPIGLNIIGGNYFWIWGIICGIFIPLTWFFGVETSGRTLEDIDGLVSIVLENKNDADWKIVPPSPALTGLDREARRVVKCIGEHEEKRLRQFSIADGRRSSIRASIVSVEWTPGLL